MKCLSVSLGTVTTHPLKAFKLLSQKRTSYIVVTIIFTEYKIASLLSVVVS